MMNAVKKTACALAVLATVSGTAMAESVDVKVIGTITPAACKPTLTGGGTIDYGAINPTTLKKDQLIALSEKQLDFAIVCDSPAKVALRAINGRPNTAAGTTESGAYAGTTPSDVSADLKKDNVNWVVGLGLDGGKKIGGYNMSLKNVTLDGVAAGRYILKKDSDNTWTSENGTNSALFWNQPYVVSWATSAGSLEPAAFTTLAGNLSVHAYLNKASELDLTKPVKLDGLATLELVYL